MSTSKQSRRSLGEISSTKVWALAVIAVAGAGTAIFGGAYIKKWFADKADDRALSEGTPESVARKMNSAMGWGNVEEDELMRIASEEIPSLNFWEKVKSAYRALYGLSLLTDLDNWKYGLDTKEMKQFMAIINSKS